VVPLIAIAVLAVVVVLLWRAGVGERIAWATAPGDSPISRSWS